MTLSGDSALGVSMGRSSGSELAYHQPNRRHHDRHRFRYATSFYTTLHPVARSLMALLRWCVCVPSAQPLPLAPPSSDHRDVALHTSVPPSLASLAGGAGVGASLGSTVFFGLDSLDFGGREIGGVATLKIPLCNPHKAPQLVIIQVPSYLP